MIHKTTTPLMIFFVSLHRIRETHTSTVFFLGWNRMTRHYNL